MFALLYCDVGRNNCDFGYVQSSNSSQEECIPELFYYNSSTQQSAYFFESVIVDGLLITENDWVGAFNGNVCVGARKWDVDNCNGICDVPVLGQDSQLTQGYMTLETIPTFKIFRAIDLSYIDANSSDQIPWSNFSTPVIDLLYACDQSDCSPDCLGINGGLAIEDCAGICDGSAVEDCEGICNGSAVEDCMGVCNGNAIISGCDNICGSTAINDECGVCGGDNSSCLDCTGIPNGSAVIDCEGVCNGSATNCDQLNAEEISGFTIISNYPNPFNPSTLINFSILENTSINLSIFDINGQEIVKLLNNEYLLKNSYQIEWNGIDKKGYHVPSGIYIINLVTSKEIYRHKVTLIK